MAKYCEICQKGVMSGNKVSHSNRRSRTYWAPNVQKVRAIVDGAPKQICVCTKSCYRNSSFFILIKNRPALKRASRSFLN